MISFFLLPNLSKNLFFDKDSNKHVFILNDNILFYHDFLLVYFDILIDKLQHFYELLDS